MHETSQLQPEARDRESAVDRPDKLGFLNALGAELAAVDALAGLAALLDDLLTLCQADAGLLLASHGAGFRAVARAGCAAPVDEAVFGAQLLGLVSDLAGLVDCPEGDEALKANVRALLGTAGGTVAALPLLRQGSVAAILVLARRGGTAFKDDDRAFLETLAVLAGLALENADLKAHLDEVHRLGRDLDSAAELQRSLQPDTHPALLPIWGINLPARKVSGDFYDFYRLEEGRFVFAMGDVSGKGMNAALLMSKTVSLFRCLGKRIDTPSALLEAINAELHETATRGMFVTMVAGHYCASSGRLCFANAGHQPPLLRMPDRSYQTFPAAAPPLGILPGTRFAEQQIDLAGGEFYVFTDGLTEYRYANGEELGVDGLIQLVELHAGMPPVERLEALLADLAEECGWEARDDLTLLTIDDAWVRSGGLDAGVHGVAVPS